jgi:hypothetical protein
MFTWIHLKSAAYLLWSGFKLHASSTHGVDFTDSTLCALLSVLIGVHATPYLNSLYNYHLFFNYNNNSIRTFINFSNGCMHRIFSIDAPLEGTGKYVAYGIHIRKDFPWDERAPCFISGHSAEPIAWERLPLLSNGGGTTCNMTGYVAPLSLIGAVGAVEYYCLS